MRKLLLTLFCLTSTTTTFAGDWPQILGPNRDGIAVDESLNFEWPASGPTVLWEVPVGNGFAGPAVKDNKLIAFHRIDDRELVQCFDAQSGQPIWKSSFPTSYVPSVSYDGGPRCVPTIHEDRVIVYGAEGELRCLKLSDGKGIWTVSTHKIYKADEGYFGAGSSPLVVGDKVIVNVGGARTGAGIVAFSLKDGSEIWKATDEAASYSSPVATKVGDREIIVAITRMQCVGLDPENGKVLLTVPFGKRGPTVNAANPQVLGDKLFLTASYGVGAVFGTLTANGLQTLWESDDLISSQYTTCVERDGKLFGVHGRQDIGVPALRCLDPLKKQVLWEETLPDYATLILADKHLLIATIGGELIVAKADSAKYIEVARANIQGATSRGSSLPALSNGLYFSRDADKLRCIDLRKK